MANGLSRPARAPRLLVSLFLAAVLLAGVQLGDGAGPARSEEDTWRQVTIVYQSDCKGKIEPCG